MPKILENITLKQNMNYLKSRLKWHATAIKYPWDRALD